MNPLRVLVVEDSELDAKLLVRNLRRGGYEVSSERVETKETMQAAMQDNAWDLVTSDYNMPAFSASEALEVLKESERDIPFIIVSGAIGEEVAVAMMKNGAHDYIMKDNLARLTPVVDRELKEAERRAQRRKAQEELRESQEENKRLLYEYSILAEIGRIISSSLDIDQVYEAFASKVHELIPFDRISINTFHQGENMLEMKYILGIDVPQRSRGELFSIEGTLSEVVISQRKGLSVNSALEAKAFPGLLPSIQAGFKASLAAPLVSNDEVFGTLQFRKTEEDVYSNRHLSLAENVASQIAGAIANAQLFAERKMLEEQLLQSQKMEAIGKLAGGVAHDFNNLLTPIMAYTQIVMESPTIGDRERKNLQSVHNASDKASHLVRQLLSFARKEIIEPTIIGLGELILNMEEMIRRLIGEDIQLVIRTASDAGLVKVDPGQIEQVLVNLVVNARDAMPRGGLLLIEVENEHVGHDFVSSHNKLTVGDYVVLIVKDSGEGMTEETIKHIFDPFFTTKEVGKGTGLGLSTCYGIVAQTGGCVTVESEPGLGSIFKVYLPQIGNSTVASPQEVNPDDIPRGTETVLLVEDERMVREVVSLILNQQGYTVLEATDGPDALRLVREWQNEIDLLLTDVIMPRMNGKELAEQVLELYPIAKVLFTSGYTDDIVLETDVNPIGSAFLQKPYKPGVVAQKVRAVLDSK